MSFQRLLAFTAFLFGVSSAIWACGDGKDWTLFTDPDAVGGIGGVGPFTSQGGFGGQNGIAGGAPEDAGADAAAPAESVARDDYYEVSALEATTVAAPGLLANDTLNTAELLPTSVSTRLGGEVEVRADGSFVYTPPSDPGPLPRVDNFHYTLQSEAAELGADVRLVLVSPPVAADDEFGTLPDGTLLLDAPGVLANDTPNGARITTFDSASSEGGVVTLSAAGAVTYSPASGFGGEDSFSYTLANVTGSATAIVHIHVQKAPVAAEDHYLGSKGELLDPEQSLLDNDALGAPQASVVSFGGGSLGGDVDDHAAGTSAEAGGSTLSVAADGHFTFDPEASLVGPFEFFYRIENSAGSSEGRVVIDVHEAPLAVDDSYAVGAGHILTVAASASDALLANDVGTPAPVVTSFGGGSLGGSVADHAVETDVEVSAGRLRVNADGSFTFSAALAASGQVCFDYHIENAAGQDEGTACITVSHGPEITSPETLVLRAGSAQNLPFALTATGTPEPQISIDGVLPEGVSFADGSLTGSADIDSAGEYELTVTATNGVEPDALQTLIITVQTEAAISGAPTATFTVGTAGSYTPVLVGVPAPLLTLDGDLPQGLAFDQDSGVISGTPAAGSGGVYEISITASNGLSDDSILLVTLTVLEAPEITSAASSVFTVGEAGSFQFTTTGHPASIVSVSGSLPTGVSFSGATATLSGTPAPGSGGTYPLTIGAANGVSPDASQSFELTVHQAPGLSGAAAANFAVGSFGSYALSSSGFPAPTLSVTGSLPNGVSFDAQTGVLSGTPGSGTSGSYALTFHADNGIGTEASLSVTLDISESSLITSASSTTFVAGSPGTFTVTASGTPAPTLALTGVLPTGVTFTPATGVLAGTPAAGTGGVYGVTISASNGVGSDGSQSFVLTVNEAPTLIGASDATFRVGVAGSYSASAIGFPAPLLVLTGTLPAGVSFAPLTGTLSGTPEPGTGGTYSLSIGAANGVGLGAALPLTLEVEESAEIDSDDEVTFTVGTAGSFTVTTTGHPTPTLELDETLPAGLTFTPETGVLEGTPAPGTGGEYTLTFSADNQVGSLATQSFTLTIHEAPGLTGASSATFVVGASGSYGVLRTGFPTPSLSLTGSLPAGLSFDANAGTISGTPQNGTAGSYSVSIGATNGIGSNASLALTLNVQQAPSITSGNSTTFTVGSAGSFTVTASGTPAPTFGVTGSLPAGVTLNTSTGVLSGTPQAGTGGAYPLTLSANNGVGSAASQTFTLTVNQAPGLSGASSASFVVGSANSYTPTATGFPAPTFSLSSGSLPSGLSLNISTGVISGTALSGSGGSYPVTLSASNGIGSAATLAVTFNVTEAPAITSGNSTTFTVGSAGSFTVTASGTPAPTFGVTGSLPAGVTLNTSTGVLSGTPQAGTGGAYPLTLSANNGVGSAASQTFTLSVNQAPSISGTPPTPVDADAAYSHTFTVSGFPAPTLSVIAGSLPTGITLSSATRTLSGTPTVPGTFSNITVRAQNSVGNADITFTIVVNVAVPPPSASGDSFAVTGNIPIDVTSSVLSNDTLNTATLTGFGPTLASAATTAPGGTLTTNGGGSVTLGADGTFSYDPPAGTIGSDSFAYTISNAGGSATAQVSLTISNRVWFVNSAAAGGGNGKFTSPFQDLPSVTNPTSGDVIYVRRSGITYSAKTLSPGQRLLGQGITVDSTQLGFSLAPFSRSAFGTAGANTSMGTLTLASGAYVRGMDVSPTVGNKGLVGSSATSLDISGMAVSASNAAAVELLNSGGSVSLKSVTASGGTNGVVITNNTGSFTITGDGSGTRNASGGTIQSTASDGLLLTNAQNITLRSLTLQGITASAVRGIIVNGFTAQGLIVSNIGTGLDFDEPTVGNANLSGVVSITGSQFQTATARFFSLANYSGTISSLTFDNNTFTTSPDDGSDFIIFDTASITSGTIQNNTYTNAGNSLSTTALHVLLTRSSLATSTPFARLDVLNNTITGSNGSGIRLRTQDCNGTLKVKVINNSVTGMTSAGYTQGIRIDSGSTTGDSTLCAQISGNTSVFTNGGLTGVTNGGLGLRRQSGSSGLNDVFGIVGLPSGSSTCPQTGTITCAATPAVESFVASNNPSGNGVLLVSATTGFSSCTLP